MMLSKSINLPTILFRFSSQVSVTRYDHISVQSAQSGVISCIEALQQSLLEPCNGSISEDDLVTEVTIRFIKHLNSHSYDSILLTSQVSVKIPTDTKLFIQRKRYGSVMSFDCEDTIQKEQESGETGEDTMRKRTCKKRVCNATVKLHSYSSTE